MKKIITAMGNEFLNVQLKNRNNIQIIMNDIQYQDGIIEALENYKKIDIIIFSDMLPGEMQVEELIKRIKEFNVEIKIILITENEDKLENNNLYEIGVYRVICINELEINELINIIENNKDSNYKNNYFSEVQNKYEKNNKNIKYDNSNNNKEINYINNKSKKTNNKKLKKLNNINKNKLKKNKNYRKIKKEKNNNIYIINKIKNFFINLLNKIKIINLINLFKKTILKFKNKLKNKKEKNKMTIKITIKIK